MTENGDNFVPGHRGVPGQPDACECGFVARPGKTREEHLAEMEALIHQGQRQSWDTAQSTFRFAGAIHERLMMPKNARKQHWSTLSTTQQIRLLKNEFEEVSELLDPEADDENNEKLIGELEDLGAQSLILWERLKGIS